ncbi:DMT family transporter [Aliikangiella sp. IMCC44359]|uniref:DMT family transporter n=1 Tax=Aliikangiella sp. IMCC44359 TaxID=3459125 RepID=UPI00403ABF87
MQPKDTFRTLIIIAIAAILTMSIVPVLIRWTSANEVTIGIVRLAIGVIGLACIRFFSKKKTQLKYQELLWLLLLGVVFAIHWLAYFNSIKVAGASLAAIGVATFGVHLLFLNYLFNKEKFNPADLFAVALSFLGIYIASPAIDINQDKLIGFATAIFSGFLYACLPLINRKLPHIETHTRALGQFGFALLVFLCLLPEANFSLTIKDWGSLLILGVVSTLIAHTLWIKASTELPTNMTAIIYYAYVPLAMLLSYFVLNETLTWQKILGASLIIAANIQIVILHQRSKKNKKPNLK